MEAAIKSRKRVPDSEFCRWNKYLRKQSGPSVFDNKNYKPCKEMPLVYHLHGHVKNPRSMVLTETDYLDFLINLSKDDEEILPYQINYALNSTSLLFLGYSLRGINFRFIFRSLMHLLGEGVGSGLQLPSLAVQLPSGFSQAKKDLALRYLDSYTKNMFKVKIYWGDVNKFTADLRGRWDGFKHVE